MLIDTHAHLYSSDFADDRDAIIQRAVNAKVSKIVLPNIDENSILPMLLLSADHPDVCFPLMGLHPTSVGSSYKEQLTNTETWLSKEKFYGVGEIGIDLYWDKTYYREQEDAFRIQLRMARTLKLPVVIHVRNSFDEVFSVIEKEQDGTLCGIFHCFSGSAIEAEKIIGLGFYIGIGGVVTFKNSQLSTILKGIDLQHIVLETDAPYLAPMPYRGKRNESSYLIYIAAHLADIYDLPVGKVAEITSLNAHRVFGI
jgi:TatD DNase family protein